MWYINIAIKYQLRIHTAILGLKWVLKLLTYKALTKPTVESTIGLGTYVFSFIFIIIIIGLSSVIWTYKGLKKWKILTVYIYI